MLVIKLWLPLVYSTCPRSIHFWHKSTCTCTHMQLDPVLHAADECLCGRNILQSVVNWYCYVITHNQFAYIHTLCALRDTLYHTHKHVEWGLHSYTTVYICNIYSMVGRSIADIYMLTKVGYRGYGLTNHATYNILYGEWATCRQTFLSAKAEKLPYRRQFLLKSISLIWDSTIMLNFPMVAQSPCYTLYIVQWLCNHMNLSIARWFDTCNTDLSHTEWRRFGKHLQAKVCLLCTHHSIYYIYAMVIVQP